MLYVDGEMPCESLHERIAGMGGVENLTVLNHEALFHLGGEVLNLGDATVQDELTTRLLEDGVKVVFLDNLSCLFSGVKENDADSWENVLSWLLTLRRHRIAVVVVHHSGRNKEMRGTSRREDAAFWVIRLETVSAEGKEGACFVSRFTKERNSGKEQPAIEWTFRTASDGRVAIADAAGGGPGCVPPVDRGRIDQRRGHRPGDGFEQRHGVAPGQARDGRRLAVQERTRIRARLKQRSSLATASFTRLHPGEVNE